MKDDLLRIAEELKELAETLPEETSLPVKLDLTKQYRHKPTGYIGEVAGVEITWNETIKLTLHSKHQNGWTAVIEGRLEEFEIVND